MKILIILMMALSLNTFASDKISSIEMHKGIVTKVLQAGIYTYVLVKNKNESLWVAISQSAVKVGEKAEFTKNLPMKNFKSKKLKKTFDLVYFASGLNMGKSEKTMSVKGTKGVVARLKLKEGIIKKADYTVSELWNKRKILSGKTILFRGKVVKVTPQVMKKNWIHLQDGTGSKEFYDLIVTSKQMAKVGDTVLIKGKVSTNKNFGFGYFYKLLVENVKLIK